MSDVIRIGTRRPEELNRDKLETVPNYKLRHVHVFLASISFREYHFHNEIEIFAVIEGTARIRRGNSEIAIGKGSILLFNPSEPHEIDADGEVIVQVIQLSKNFIQQYFPRLSNTVFEVTEICSAVTGEIRRRLWQNILGVGLSYIRGDECFELETLSQLCNILQLLLKHVPNKVVSEDDYLAKKKVTQRMERLVAYIDANYQYQIRLKDAAEEEGITPTHLSHFFTENFGKSFQQYLNNIRYQHAIRLMKNSRMSNSEIAAASGFSDLKYMTQIFIKKHGMKPKEYRERECGESSSEQETTRHSIQHELSAEESVIILEDVMRKLNDEIM